MKKFIRTAVIIILLLVAFGLIKKNTTRLGGSQPSTTTLANPASVYCEEHGGKSVIRTNGESSGEIGYCDFGTGMCEEWAYFRGECPSTGTEIITGINEINTGGGLTGGFAFTEFSNLDSPYSGVVQYVGKITSQKDLKNDFVMGNESGLQYCNAHTNEWGTTTCPTEERLLITVANGYFDSKLFFNTSFCQDAICNVSNKLPLGCLQEGKLSTTSFDEKYTRYISLFSPEDEKTVIDNADKDTLFTFKIVKNAYNIPARDIGQCETFVDKIMIVK